MKTVVKYGLIFKKRNAGQIRYGQYVRQYSSI
jgi:hypothetical protein